MIWFNIKELETRLINREVTEKLAFTYLLAHLILLAISSHIGVDDDPLWMVLVHLLISLVATVWGVKKTYEINRQGGGIDYFKRFLSLSFVAGIRTLVITFLVMFVGMTIVLLVTATEPLSFFMPAYVKAGLELGGFLLIVALYYSILLGSFRRINQEGRGAIA